MTDSPIYLDLHPHIDKVKYWVRKLGQGDKECLVAENVWQIQNNIDLKEHLWVRKTENPSQTLVFTKTAGCKTSPESMLYCYNQNIHAPITEVISLGPPPPPTTTTSWDFQFSLRPENPLPPHLSGQKPPNPLITQRRIIKVRSEAICSYTGPHA